MSETEWNFSIFSAAPSGWRVAIADNKDQKLLVVGIVGWARLTSIFLDGPPTESADRFAFGG
ncbi:MULTISPECIES: hypothetical protein [Streptomyces]|nr:hypothetical protein [Streptomyces canarius]